jgi:hypothetical protein
VAEFVEASGGIAGAGEGEDGETEEAALQQAAEDLGWSRHHFHFGCPSFEGGGGVPAGLGPFSDCRT